MDNLEYQYIPTNGVRLHVTQAGPKEGPLVLLLHGFPEFWYGWRYQIPYLAEAGYRVWAPDQRGYNLSEKPGSIGAYGLDELVADLVGLIDASGQERVCLVGHDWGGVAWCVADAHPERVRSLVILNCPHPRVLQEQVLRNPAQLLRSSYMLFFQIPWLPETLARLGHWTLVVRAMKRSSRPGAFTEGDFEQYREAWSRPGAFSSMLNWYRALLRKPTQFQVNQRIKSPTLLIWGTQDQFLGKELAQPSIDLCADGRLIFLPGASHWLHHEEPARVNHLIGDFLRSNREQ